MSALPPVLVSLIALLGKLPGIGPRSAERIGLHLMQLEIGQVEALSQNLIKARQRILACQICGALTESQPCRICRDDSRDPSLLCLVEKPTDILSLEKPGTFKGRFHVLGGKISPINGVEPEELRIRELEERLEPEGVREVVLALPSDVEGDATSFYLARLLRARGVVVSRLAQGLPAGSGLEFADELTLSRALEGRRELL